MMSFYMGWEFQLITNFVKPLLFGITFIQVILWCYYLAEESENLYAILGPVLGAVTAVLVIIIAVLCCVILHRRYRRKNKIYHIYAKTNEG